MTALAPPLAAFLREHLPRDRRASPHTCEAYAYSFQLLVTFAARRLRTQGLDTALFLNGTGRAMTRSGFEYILAKHIEIAAAVQPSIIGKKVSPHVLRHSCAMHTLQATRDIRKVALWLGHASLQSTEAYLRADPSEKLEALSVTSAPNLTAGRFRPPDKLLAMLNGK
ncbi:MAG: integrase [Methylobacterium sp.]|nr:integrase [Methylobacterium sp.]